MTHERADTNQAAVGQDEREGPTLPVMPATGVQPKVLLVANTGWYLYNFRRNLIRRLQQQGRQVTVVCPTDEYVARLEAEGVRSVAWQLNRSSMHPWRGLLDLFSLVRTYRREAPLLVHHFTIKAILYGTLAAKWAGVPCIVNSVTGLGHVFLSQRWAARLLRPAIRRWYVWALTAQGVSPIFQNREDLTELARSSAELTERAILSSGSGVDLDRFLPLSPRGPGNGQNCALFAGRLIREKGIREFVDAGRLCRQRGIDTRLVVCGNPDPGNPSSVDADLLQAWQQEDFVELLGHVERLEEQIREADVVVLPSYREGTPKVLLEAAAMGKPIIASDVPGCREVVVHGENGLLVPPGDAPALAAAMETMFADEQLRTKMGAAGRRRVLDHFDERQVISQTVRMYDELLQRPSAAVAERAGAARSRGTFVLSLDFELAWGTRGRPAARHVGPFLDGTRPAIQGLLALFEKYHLPATWAVVGGLLLTSRDPTQRHPWLRDDAFADIPAGDAETQPHWYAEDVLEWLKTHSVEQEIACHTLTHQFVDPTPAGRETFREELRRFRQLFEERFLVQPQTFIFPKARMGHFDVLVEEGFRCIRGPESKWFERLPGQRLRAGLRLLDARLACRPHVGRPQRRPAGLWVLPSSQFYSPFLSVGKYVSVEARVRKALKGLRAAASQRRMFHLWTHPFNLGVRTAELLDGLEQIFREARRLREAGQLEILTMGQVTERLDAGVERTNATSVRPDGA
jgi:glycosyltransferase involved in cell wall biosynthesis